MNYFELFNLPISLQNNNTEVLKKYYALCKQNHPDNYTLQNEDAQFKAEEMTALINQAKKVLDDPQLRLSYILRLHEQIADDEKFQLPPAFLGEMMDINEQLMELEFAPDVEAKEKVKQEIKDMEVSLFDEVKAFFEKDVLSIDDIKSDQLKSYYYKRKYLDRILEKL